MNIYFNEFEPFAAGWLSKLFPLATIDQRSIIDVAPADVAGFSRCHFFGGIGGWELALQLAGWPADRPVWTGSCPCQPFSQAGKRKGAEDARHLWPEFCRLIAERKPATIFGEQVASKDGRKWLAGVRADLEALGYAVGAADLCAAGESSPHIRQRLYWVADLSINRCGQGNQDDCRSSSGVRTEGNWCRSSHDSESERLGLADGDGRPRPRISDGRTGEVAGTSEACGMDNALLDGRQAWRSDDTRDDRIVTPANGGDGGVGDASCERLPPSQSKELRGPGRRLEGRAACESSRPFWSDFDVVHCRDGKTRRIEPGPQQMADGFSELLGRLRSDASQKIEKELIDAEISEADAREALRNLWCNLASQSVQRTPGRFRSIYEAPVLLSILRELARKGWKLLDHLPSACWKTPEDGLREMRQDSLATSCSPQRRNSRQQSAGKLADAMSVVSQAVARAGIDGNMIPHPLAHGVSNRVGRLRGYGNAIVPQAAAAFIRAFLEVESESHV